MHETQEHRPQRRKEEHAITEAGTAVWPRYSAVHSVLTDSAMPEEDMEDRVKGAQMSLTELKLKANAGDMNAQCDLGAAYGTEGCATRWDLVFRQGRDGRAHTQWFSLSSFNPGLLT
ncbi:hypothetical protein CYMTET_32864 [Cymbomonas tetramitiformis]|uniref:Uncharacterized protein n=1 Tax=Cymbomonas tetramitiformis TaxID=36881 RepID=A0AAE0KRF4_9CHLO|nr:hypothetical protein CYMTET_32864 [Cymbomonas tetramitiformis]